MGRVLYWEDLESYIGTSLEQISFRKLLIAESCLGRMVLEGGERRSQEDLFK